MLKTFRHVLFLLHFLFIISSELLLHITVFDYSTFIERLTQRLASINILYVKVFQAIALNNSLIDDKTNNKLLSFTDNAPWNYGDINFEELIEVADKYNLFLPYGYDAPINSGMISLVFKAYNKNTQKPLIIKMKRKNIDIKLNNAIQNLQFCMHLLSFIPIIKKYQIIDVVNKNIDIIKHQTNFSEEVKNMTKVKQNCANLKYVVIPEAYADVTHEYPNVILMEYIDGLKINKIKEEDYEDFAKQVLKFGFVTTIVHGVAHGDLHGGNILFIKDDKEERYKHKIAVIDFGIIFELDAKYKSALFSLLTKMFEIPPRDTAIKILNSGFIDPPNIFDKIPNEKREQILKFGCEIIEETIIHSKKANQLQIYKFLKKLNEYLSCNELSDAGIKPSDNLVKTQLVLAMAQGVTLTLCKEDFFTVADHVINDLFKVQLLM